MSRWPERDFEAIAPLYDPEKASLGLAEKLGVTDRQARRIIAELKKRNLLTFNQRYPRRICVNCGKRFIYNYVQQWNCGCSKRGRNYAKRAVRCAICREKVIDDKRIGGRRYCQEHYFKGQKLTARRKEALERYFNRELA